MKLSSKAKSTLNDTRYLEQQAKWFNRLENLFNGRPDPYLDEYAFVLKGISGSGQCDMYNNPGQWIMECLENLSGRIKETEKEFTFVPLCVNNPFYGVHFVDKIFGANVFFKDNQWWSDCLTTPVGALSMPDLENNETFTMAKKACRIFLEQELKLPLFGLPTIASALNVIINIYGEKILIAMMTEPEAAKHDLRVVQDVLVALHKWYREIMPAENLQPVVPAQRTQPFNYGQICGCSHALISPECYDEFIAPLDAELLGIYPNGGMMHICGSHLQHLKTFHDMKELRAVQMNDRAAHDLKSYYNGLRKDQIIYLMPCGGMTVERAMEITGGERIVIVDKVDGALRKHKKNCD